MNNILDSVLLIKTDDEIRKSRAIKRKNISLTEIERRMNLQMDEQKKAELAAVIIKNNKSAEDLFRDLDKFYNKIIK